jgi:hypothetical protein
MKLLKKKPNTRTFIAMFILTLSNVSLVLSDSCELHCMILMLQITVHKSSKQAMGTITSAPYEV